MDRDQREAARREGVAEHLDHPCALVRGAARRLREHEVADLRRAAIGDEEVDPRLLVDRYEAVATRVLPQDAEDELLGLGELLHREAAVAAPRLLDARQHTVAHAQRAALGPLDDADARRRGAPLPFVGDGEHPVGDLDDAQHCDLGQAAALVDRPLRPRVELPGVGHVAEQRLQRDLVLRVEAERLGDLALADGGGRRRDEGEDLLGGRQAGGRGGGAAGHGGVVGEGVAPRKGRKRRVQKMNNLTDLTPATCFSR